MNKEPLFKLIRLFEGFRSKPYICPAGVATIGYGSTGKDITMAHPPVTQVWAEARMSKDSDAFVIEAIKYSPILALPENADKLCAIADFCYNLGSTRYKASTLRKKVNAGRWQDAGKELEKWVWGGGKKLPGLVTRRQAEKALITKI